VTTFVQGAIMLASFAISLFFLKYWRQTRDRLFGVFSAAFVIYGVSRILLSFIDRNSEARAWVFLLRVLMFAAIIGAIVDKNISRSPDDRGP
jgi:hypothetical protein